jgi:glycogen synthase
MWEKIVGLQHAQKYKHAKLKVFFPKYTRCQENILTTLTKRRLNFFGHRRKKYYVQYVQYTTGCGLHYYLKALQKVFTEEPFGK